VSDEVVLDASALLALLNQEQGSDVVAASIPEAIISTVNLSEVISKLVDAGLPEAVTHQVLDGLMLNVVPFDEVQAFKAGMLRLQTKALGLSFGDRACLALAKYLDRPVLTADQIWRNLDLGVDVRLIR
jgi:PIN domain nuclease of toxin-antitoxin system